MFFAGSFEHALDSKNRVVIPTKFRILLTDPLDRKGLVATLWKRHGRSCVHLFPQSTWPRRMEELEARGASSASRDDLKLFLSSSAEFCRFDKQWRMSLPHRLVGQAGLAGSVTLVGAHDHMEVWDTEAWAAVQKELEDKLEKTFDR